MSPRPTSGDIYSGKGRCAGRSKIRPKDGIGSFQEHVIPEIHSHPTKPGGGEKKSRQRQGDVRKTAGLRRSLFWLMGSVHLRVTQKEAIAEAYCPGPQQLYWQLVESP